MNLDITCKGVKDITSSETNSDLDVTLSDVNPDFIEQLDVKDIVKYADNQKLMNELDLDELIEHLESLSNVTVIKEK